MRYAVPCLREPVRQALIKVDVMLFTNGAALTELFLDNQPA